METYKFELTKSEADIVILSLGKQPYELTAEVIHKLQGQFSGQIEKNKLDKKTK